MRDVHKIIDVSVTTTSNRPLCGIVGIETADSTVEFELTEEIALSICTGLERFLTQQQDPAPALRLCQ